jgi:hypothetical protein
MVDLLCFKVIGVAKNASLGDIPRYTKIIILNIYKIKEYTGSMVSTACIYDLVIL